MDKKNVGFQIPCYYTYFHSCHSFRVAIAKETSACALVIKASSRKLDNSNMR